MTHAAVIYAEEMVEQVAEDLWVDVSRAYTIAWAEANGFAVTGTHPDAEISDEEVARFAPLQAALRAVCSTPGSTLIVYSLSQIADAGEDLISLVARLERAGCYLASVSEKLDTSTPIGKQFARAMRGSDAPFGYRVAGDGLSLEEDPLEQATLADVRDLRRSGWSWQRIAAELNDRGITPPGRARVWNWLSASKVAA